MKNKWNWHGVQLISLLVYLSMLVPLAVVVINSFNPQRIAGFPPQELSLVWYHEFLKDDLFIDAIWVSVQVGLVTVTGHGASPPPSVRLEHWLEFL